MVLLAETSDGLKKLNCLLNYTFKWDLTMQSEKTQNSNISKRWKCPSEVVNDFNYFGLQGVYFIMVSLIILRRELQKNPHCRQGHYLLFFACKYFCTYMHLKFKQAVLGTHQSSELSVTEREEGAVALPLTFMNAP